MSREVLTLVVVLVVAALAITLRAVQADRRRRERANEHSPP